jgi:hypothetical protein
MSMSTTSTSTSTSTTKEQQGGRRRLYEYAGYVAEFSSIDGSLLPVPSRYVPEELLMWNQVPSTLEILVSEEEQFDNDYDSDSSNINTMAFHRRTNTILPGVGCGLDNLHTNQSDEKYSYSFKNDDGIVMIHNNNNNEDDDDTVADADNNKIVRIWQNDTNSVSTLDSILRTTAATSTSTKTRTKTLRLENMFVLPNDHRLRVSLDLNVIQIITSKTHRNGNGDVNNNNRCARYRYKLTSTSSIKIQWERCYNKDKDNNNNKVGGDGIDGNGHLDVGTVFSLIGEELRHHRNQITTATATTTSIMDNNDKDNININNKCIEQQQINDTTPLHLPGNIMVSTGYIGDNNNKNKNDDEEGWYIDISLLSFPSLDMISTPTSTTNNTKSTAKETTTTTPRTIRRKFQHRTDDGCCLIISYI